VPNNGYRITKDRRPQSISALANIWATVVCEPNEFNGIGDVRIAQLEDLESLFDLEEDKLRERLDAVFVGKAV
jgi:hypothetical protein